MAAVGATESAAGPETVDVAIVGAGLSGLAAARWLSANSAADGAAAPRMAVFEAAPRVGGRTASTPDGHDLGGAWCWPFANPHLVRLADKLGVERRPQPGDRPSEGLADLYEPGLDAAGDGRSGQVHRSRGQPQGWERFEGGAVQLAELMAAALPPSSSRLHLDTVVAEILVQDQPPSSSSCEEDFADTDSPLLLRGTDGQDLVRARAVIVAVPPRVAAATIAFQPALAPARRAAMEATPTWMGGNGKVVATYARAFWREQGLSGAASSERGPLTQIYDATTRDRPALCGFVFGARAAQLGQSAESRADLERQAVEQLARLFGAEAATPLAVHSHSWRGDRHITPDPARPGPAFHPRANPVLSEPHGRVFWAGAEAAITHTCGLLDGAVAAGERAAQQAAQALGINLR